MGKAFWNRRRSKYLQLKNSQGRFGGEIKGKNGTKSVGRVKSTVVFEKEEKVTCGGTHWKNA